MGYYYVTGFTVLVWLWPHVVVLCHRFCCISWTGIMGWSYIVGFAVLVRLALWGGLILQVLLY